MPAVCCLSSVLNVDPAGQGDKQGSQQLGVPGTVIVGLTAQLCISVGLFCHLKQAPEWLLNK